MLGYILLSVKLVFIISFVISSFYTFNICERFVTDPKHFLTFK